MELRGILYHCYMGGFPKSGVQFWGPHNEDHNILGAILGSPCFGKLPYKGYCTLKNVCNVLQDLAMTILVVDILVMCGS